MVYTGEVPWHGMGNYRPGVMTAAEAIEGSDLGWSVYLAPLVVPFLESDGTVTYKTLENDRAVIRDFDRKHLGTVTKVYKPIQNIEAFQFFDEIVDSGEAKYEVAGSLSGGRKIWLTAKVGDSIQIAGQDPHDLYLLLVSSHDGSRSLTAVTTLIRAVCKNTVTFGIDTAKTSWKFSHRKELKARTLEARDALQMSFKYVEEFEREAQKMIDMQITKDQFEAIIKDALPEQKHATQKKTDEIMRLFESSPTIVDAGIGGTVYGAYQAVTEWTSHKSFQTKEARMISNLNGDDAKFRDKMQKALVSA
jgi:phage/plasmid-like protein (TIGR03299 family)